MAKSTSGTVQGNLPGIQFADDGRSAKGNVNRLGRPTVEAVASGDLFLNAGPRSPATKDPGGAPTENRNGSGN